jgi:hypothetical protein
VASYVLLVHNVANSKTTSFVFEADLCCQLSVMHHVEIGISNASFFPLSHWVLTVLMNHCDPLAFFFPSFDMLNKHDTVSKFCFDLPRDEKPIARSVQKQLFQKPGDLHWRIKLPTLFL